MHLLIFVGSVELLLGKLFVEIYLTHKLIADASFAAQCIASCEADWHVKLIKQCARNATAPDALLFKYRMGLCFFRFRWHGNLLVAGIETTLEANKALLLVLTG